MKHSYKTGICISAMLAITMSLLTGCKTSEANYRSAYEMAKAASSDGIDSTIYARIRQEAVPTAVTSGGDSIRIMAEFTTPYIEKGMESPKAHPYGVVVAQFKQVFNAKAMRNRLHQSGYPDAYIVSTREPLYYVVIQGADDLTQATDMWKNVSRKKPVAMRAPFPWILKDPRQTH